MLNMESPQMYDTVQTLSQLDLKKQPAQAIIGQITLTAMSNNGNSSDANNNHNNGLVVNKHSVHHMQQAAAVNNNNNNNNTSNSNTSQQQQQQQNNNVAATSMLQKQMMQQYSQSDLDELTTQEITLDLQHLIDDQFREQEALGIFSDMVASPGGFGNNGLNTNGVVSAAAKVLQQHQLQQQTLRSSQPHGYNRNALAYMPQAVHSGANYSNNSSGDENSSVGSEASTIKEEPIDPQEYRRQLQDGNAAAAAFIGAANGTANGLYNLSATGGNLPYQGPNSGASSNNAFTTLNTPNGLHHPNLPHLTAGAHLLKSHHLGNNKQMLPQRKQSQKNIDKGTDEYRRRRERNNIAVRKSREKAKVRSREVEERVKTLLKEKDALLRRLEEMTNEIQLHKQIYMQLMNHANPEVSRICRSFLNMSDHGL